MGNIVHLGDFDSFSLQVQGEGAETAEELGARHIVKTFITFRPGVRFKELLASITYDKDVNCHLKAVIRTRAHTTFSRRRAGVFRLASRSFVRLFSYRPY
jgi:hypothetical protein